MFHDSDFHIVTKREKKYAYVMVPLQSQPAKCGMLWRPSGKSA